MKTISLSSVHPNPWLRQFPDRIPEWDGWKFVFNAENEPYDYLVVFDDLHEPIKPNCPSENIIHLATEPPSVCRYDENFLRQFAWVITQDNALKHSGKILHQPGLTWFIGWKPGENDNSKIMIFHELVGLFELPKSKLISVIASNKAFTPEHAARLEFAKKLKEHYGDKIDFYGRGFVPMDDKLDSLKDYRFQVVLENSSYNHYFSEKLTDCVLAGTYPIYYGCPNLDDYFPSNSYLRIDIHDFQGSVAAIDKAIEQNFDQKYRTELLKARDQTLNEHNLFPMLIKIIEQIENGDFGKPYTNTLYGEEMLPFGHERFQTLFGPKVNVPFRIQLSNLANKNPLFGLLRRLYRIARGR
jgi:hypothetical protein